MRQMMGGPLRWPPDQSPETRQALLDRLVDEEVLRQAAANQGVVIPPSVLQRQIADIPAFEFEGQFSVDQYRLLLAGQNMTPREFEQRIFRDLGSSGNSATDRVLSIRDRL